jgi:hypothetical protein
MLNKKKTFAIGSVLAASILLTAGACDGPTAAAKANENISTAADNFEVQRKITAVNLRSGEFIFFAEGRCSLDIRTSDVLVTCKRGPDEYSKDHFAQGPDIFWSAVQQDPIDVSIYKTRIIIKPEGIIPEVELSTGIQ